MLARCTIFSMFTDLPFQVLKTWLLVDTLQRNKTKEREYSNIEYPQMTNARSKPNMTCVSRSSSV
jgi:hypothetical protein